MGKVASAIIFFLLVFSFAAVAQERVSPFSAVRWIESPVPEVLVDGQWYRLVKADGIEADTLTYFALEGAGRWWQRAYVDWFEWLLGKAGRELGPTITLTLSPMDNDNGNITVSVPVTGEKYRNAWRHYYITSRLADLEREPAVPADLEYLSRRIDGHVNAPPSPDVQTDPGAIMPCIMAGGSAGECMKKKWITPGEAVKDLAIMEWLLDNKFSYHKLNDSDYSTAINTIRTGIEDGITRRDFALQIQRLLALLGDGHSRVSFTDSAIGFPGGVTPFRMIYIQDRIAAVNLEMSDFADHEHPLLKSIDGIPVEHWLSAASEFVSKGSLQHKRYQTVSVMHRIGLLRAVMGLEQYKRVVYTLEDVETGSTKSFEEDVASYFPSYDERDANGMILDNNIGYLRIRSMNGSPEFIDRLEKLMNKFRETDGLIIDLRDNGGGTRDVINKLLPYFMTPGELLRIVNVSALRTNFSVTPDYPEGFLSAGYAYPASSSRWSDEQRKLIKEFTKSFEPQMDLPVNEFGRWHFMAVQPELSEDGYHYTKPVVVIMNSSNFSAADIFLGAMKELEQVTLLGTPSQGGSGHPERYYLPHSGIVLRLSSMVTFQPCGALYEGRGITPDIHYEKDMEYWRMYFDGHDPLIKKAADLIAENN